MLKVMNLLILTLSMNILMSISSNAEITEADKNRWSETFNDLDCDQDGFITEGDVNSFFSDPEKQKKIDGMILNKEKFKEALINKIRENGTGMDLKTFVIYLYRGESFEEMKTMVQGIFPGQTEVQREKICNEEVFEMLKNNDDLRKFYTIEELTQFIFFNHELFD